ncbi:MAG: class I SAM-dependent methyltransferase [Clostridiales bacterium]|nr:class I SAM-dependent methyltransferase [Clostridiales bacterium]
MSIKSIIKRIMRPVVRPLMVRIRNIVREELESVRKETVECKLSYAEAQLETDKILMRLAGLERRLRAHVRNEVPFDYSCDICDRRAFSLLFDRERNGEDMYNYICESCGFVFMWPRPTEKELMQLYQQSEFSLTARGSVMPDAQKYYDCERAAMVRYSDFQKHLSDACLDRPKGLALDIGTGVGSFVDVLRRNEYEAEGLEPDVTYAENSEKHYSITVHKVPLENFKPTRKYNLITAFNVLEHVLHPMRFVEDMRDLLHDAGILYLDMPGLDQMHTDIDKFFWKPHINTFTISSLRDLLQKCGFEPIYIGYSSLGFLDVMAKKDISASRTMKIGSSQALNVARAKSIIDAAYYQTGQLV